MLIVKDFSNRFADFEIFKEDLIIFNNIQFKNIQKMEFKIKEFGYYMELCKSICILSRNEYGLFYINMDCFTFYCEKNVQT